MAILLIQAVMALAASYLLVRCCLGRLKMDPEAQLMALGLFIVAQIVGAGLVLGYSRILTVDNLLWFHLVVLALAGILARKQGLLQWPSISNGFQRMRNHLKLWTRLELAGGALVLVLLGLLFVPAAIAEPQVHDCLSYRLSRVGYWLQEQNLFHFPTNEQRQNYTPFNVDLLMLWLTAPFKQGFPLVSLAQFGGGVLLLLATWGLGRQLGLNRPARLGTWLVILGMPNVAAEFTTSQTDLATGGLLTSGLYFFLLGFRERQFAWPAWLGIGLALGAKGTVLYWGPGLVVLTGMWFWARRPAWAVVRAHLLPALVCLTLMGLPRYIENQINYKNPFAPENEVHLLTLNNKGGWLGKMSLNSFTYFIETFEPDSNPIFMKPLVQPVWKWLMTFLPPKDDYGESSYPRRESMLMLDKEPYKNADIVSFGVLACGLLLLGAAAVAWNLWRQNNETARLRFGVAICTLLFFPVFTVYFIWWPSNFRYFCLLAGLMALTAAFGVETFFPGTRVWIWLAVAVATVFNLADVNFNTFNAGYRTMQADYQTIYKYQNQMIAERKLIQEIVPDGSRVGVALSWNSILAGFFRNGRTTRVYFLPAERAQQLRTPEKIMRVNQWDALVTSPGIFPKAGSNVIRQPILLGNNKVPYLMLYSREQPRN